MIPSRVRVALRVQLTALAIVLSAWTPLARGDAAGACKAPLRQCAAGLRTCTAACSAQAACKRKCFVEGKKCVLKVESCGDDQLEPILSAFDCMLAVGTKGAETPQKCADVPWP